MSDLKSMIKELPTDELNELNKWIGRYTIERSKNEEITKRIEKIRDWIGGKKIIILFGPLAGTIGKICPKCAGTGRKYMFIRHPGLEKKYCCAQFYPDEVGDTESEHDQDTAKANKALQKLLGSD